MAGMTRTKMLAERRCGLKYYDKAVILVGQTAIIDKTIEFFKGFPDHSPNEPWITVHWAFSNAVKDLINCIKDVTQTYNLMDVLQEQDIIRIQNELGLVGNPPDIWSRKP